MRRLSEKAADHGEKQSKKWGVAFSDDWICFLHFVSLPGIDRRINKSYNGDVLPGALPPADRESGYVVCETVDIVAYYRGKRKEKAEKPPPKITAFSKQGNTIMKKMCVFDLDGTLTNTLPTIAYYINHALAEIGLADLGEIPTDRFRYYVGNGAELLCHRSLAHFGLDDEVHADLYDALYRVYNRDYDAAPLYLTCPYDGMAGLADTLRGKGIYRAVLSNKPDYAAGEVVRHFYGDRFQTVRGARPGVPLKPAPDALLDLLAGQGIAPGEAVMIGDTSVDIRTGRAAGVTTVGVTWGFRERAELEEAGADHIIDRPDELLSVLA